MTVFISRSLEEAPEFTALLTAAGWKAEGLSLVRLSPLPESALPDCAWVFFASKNAVRFFYETYGNPPASAALGALGPATGEAVRQAFGRIDFVGNGDPSETAARFRPLAEGRRVLFPAARHSRRSVPEALGDAIEAVHLAVYDNEPVPDPPETRADVLVFTSPMNARAYLDRHSLQPFQRAVAIGQTTAAALRELGVKNPVIASEPSEQALAKTVLALPL